MSKLTKLITNPVKFFEDAKAKRVAQKKDSDNKYDNYVGDKIPTFMFGFSEWKKYLSGSKQDRKQNFIETKEWNGKTIYASLRRNILSHNKPEFFFWGLRVKGTVVDFAKEHKIPFYFMEDGFLRSIGLGAAHTPAYSLTLDSQTPFFDARNPSDLENILKTYDFAAHPELIERAKAMIVKLRETGLSKYNHAKAVDIEKIYGPKTKRRILVVGQVEDDASILYGCDAVHTNNDVVMIAALENPDAQIIYKPHPDVMNKHREMVSNPQDVRNLCLIVKNDIPLAQALETIDHVYTITSQAGFEALLRGVKVTTLGCPFYAGWGLTDERQPNPRRNRKLSVEEIFAAAYLLYPIYFDPVYKVRITPEQAIERLLILKNLADSSQKGILKTEDESANDLAVDRKIPTFIFGMSPWRDFLADCFPEREIIFISRMISASEFEQNWVKKIEKALPEAEIFIWGYEISDYLAAFVREHDIKVIYLEDGFIRSIGLGATKMPPFSLTLDSQAPYFDARRPTDLEDILNSYDFASSPALLERARDLISFLLSTGISKYNNARRVDVESFYGPKLKKRVLVVGQVEDDASITFGSSKRYSNNDVVVIAALENPEAQIIYKPHPDVLSKNRNMLSDPNDVRHLCLVLTQDIPLAQAFETIDHVYTITSQAGFEALLRGIKVTTLGCPFYSGWGLTDERQPNPRRQRTLTMEEVFAAAYLLYPKYFDPVYRTKITAERAVERLQGMRSSLDILQITPSETEPDTGMTQNGMSAVKMMEEIADLKKELFTLTEKLAQMNVDAAVNTTCQELSELRKEIARFRSMIGA
mgnify:CR=1 FL=1